MINADPDAEIIRGPKIELGGNPWGYADEHPLATLRKAAYENQGPGIVRPARATNGEGTISHVFTTVNGVGVPGTLLCGSIPNTATLSRDTGYLGAWLTLTALFDPDPAQRSVWKTNLRAPNVRDKKCKGSDSSWAIGCVFNPVGAGLNVTNGRDVVRAEQRLAACMCYGIASGSVTVTMGSATFAGVGLVEGHKTVISRTRGSAPRSGMFRFVLSNGTSGGLAALWPGDAGAYPFIIENNDYYSTIATSKTMPW